MTAVMSAVLNIVQLVAVLITVVTFWLGRRKDTADRIVRQANLDNSIATLNKTVDHLDRVILAQAERQSAEMRAQAEQIQNIKLIVELLLQQHRMNHGQHINGGTD